MKEKGVSGYKMSKDLNFKESYIYAKIKKQEYNPNIKNALIIADYLGVNISEIFSIKK